MVGVCTEQETRHVLRLTTDLSADPLAERHDVLVDTPIACSCEICIIVPVCNEAELLESCLKALRYQIDLDGKQLDLRRYEVIIFANNCTDNSASIARRFGQQHPAFNLHVVERTLSSAEAYIGRVRQMLMDEAYRRFMSVDRRQGVIASTDGDTQVSPDWIAATLDEICQGADVVAGHIMTDRKSLSQLSSWVRSRYLRSGYYHHLKVKLEAYIDEDPFNPWPRHHHNYGASLAVTAEIYKKSGGMPAVRTPEDVAFCAVLVRLNARFRHSIRVSVTTSARSNGRTDIGFANLLAQWSGMGQQAMFVESLGEIETRFQARKQIRTLWQRVLGGHSIQMEDVRTVAIAMGVAERWFLNELKQSQTVGFLLERVDQEQVQEGAWKARWKLVELEQAIESLQQRTDLLYREKLQLINSSNALN